MQMKRYQLTLEVFKAEHEVVGMRINTFESDAMVHTQQAYWGLIPIWGETRAGEWWGCIRNDVDVAPESAECKNKAVNLPVSLCTYLHLRSWCLGRQQKNKLQVIFIRRLAGLPSPYTHWLLWRVFCFFLLSYFQFQLTWVSFFLRSVLTVELHTAR